MTEETQTQTQPEPRKSLSLLASERFGDAFTGKVEHAQPESPPAGLQEPAEQSEIAHPESGDDASHAPEESESGEDQASPEASPDDEAGETPSIETFAELAEHFELDQDWARQLKVSVKVNGSTSEVPLADAIQSYEIGQATKERLEEAKQHARTAREEWSQKSQQLDGQIASVAALIGAAEKLLDQDAAGLDALRDDNPAEFAARKAELADRRQAIQDLKRQAAEGWTNSQQQRQQEHQNLIQERLGQEAQSLLEKMPEWQDAERAKREKAELSEYLASQGFSRDEVANAIDHRAVVIARKAMLFDRQNANGTVARKKLAKVPKTLKPGTPKPQDQRDREQIGKAQNRLRQTGKLDDALAVIRAKRANNGRSSRNIPNQ